ncbi:shikimate dehydrogenase [Sodalis sp. CWE]|uniref:shikimate dehydrogenase n=1 Tax=Sodalis sp. CWE TaxID=2803816 RepID=UPI001C7D0095|nr:shikimate dehydrogenase [Sodalis sp. CWE]MBX4180856.1 shikimate dehydrogenase [Sodalis sp. CWE]
MDNYEIKKGIKNAFAVFGNPIHHSYSPSIYSLFSYETGITYPYVCIQTTIKSFSKTLKQFFDSGGLGANITLPFKEYALSLCDQLTEVSSLTGTVNTIKKQNDGSLLGDNTDGIGLITDLKRLNFIYHNSRVLLVGAGGAARGVIPYLLRYGCKVTLTNRTFSRALKLIQSSYKSYCKAGYINALSIENLKAPNYDLIINATSSGIKGQVPLLSTSLISSSVCCYDMFYQKGDTPFITWGRQNGALHCSDGLGMLVHQAAMSFLLWHGILPSVLPVLKILRRESIYK